jgi:hypothetical protein
MAGEAQRKADLEEPIPSLLRQGFGSLNLAIVRRSFSEGGSVRAISILANKKPRQIWRGKVKQNEWLLLAGFYQAELLFDILHAGQ